MAARRAAPGLTVVVIDAARFPREKPCGGALTGGGLRELELAGLLLRVPRAPVTHAALRIDGVTRRVELPRPAAVVRRIELDADLVSQVRRAGAEVREGAALSSLELGRALTSGGPIAFQAMVAADGAGGRTRRALGLPAGRRVPLRETQLDGAGERDLLFDLDAVARGYAWRFPCIAGGRAAESCGVYALEPSGSLATAMAELLAGAGGTAGGPVQSSSLRLFDPSGPVGAGRALLAGDALGADALAGEGLRYAFWSGRLAGALAAGALRRGRAPSLREYRARLLVSRSGILLQLGARLAGRHHGSDPRWRRAAADGRVAAALAALVSGAHPVRPLLALAARYPALA